MGFLRKISTELSKVANIVAAVGLVLMMVHIIADAVLRNWFSLALPGTTEFVAFYYMTAVTFLPLAFAQGCREHVMIELFTRNLRPRVIYAIDGVATALISAGAAYFAYAAGWKAVAMTRAGEYQIGMTIVLTWPARWFVVAGLALLALVALFHAIDDFLTALGRRSEEEAVALRERGIAEFDTVFGLRIGS